MCFALVFGLSSNIEIVKSVLELKISLDTFNERIQHLDGTFVFINLSFHSLKDECVNGYRKSQVTRITWAPLFLISSDILHYARLIVASLCRKSGYVRKLSQSTYQCSVPSFRLTQFAFSYVSAMIRFEATLS